MISKESDITKEFIRLVFEATHKKWYVIHAIDLVKNEDNMIKIIEYLNNNPNALWQDIEYNILMLAE